MAITMEPTEFKQGPGRTVAFLEISSLLFGISAWIAVVFNQLQPTAYMDEVFHVPQAQQYCKGHFFAWDSKITTPPGLYLVSIGVIHPLAELAAYSGFQELDLCSTFWLRCINILFTIGNLYVIMKIYLNLHALNKELSSTKALSVAINLTLLPVLYFFTFLYYTDVGSTFFALLMYLLHLYDSQFMSACMGLVAIAFRQTNIIWIVFTAGSRVVYHLTEHVKTNTIPDPEDKRSNTEYLIYTLRRLLWHPHKSFATLVWNCFCSTFFYQLIGAAFVYFLNWNHGSLVLGDHTSHQPVFNAPQLSYFLLFTGVFGFPYLFSYYKIVNFTKYFYRRPLTLILLAALFGLSIRFFTEVHPYLLADNRHYPFYFWRRIYSKSWLVPYLMIPLHVFILHSISTRLQVQNLFWKALLFLCISMASVPQKLLEFRYFILPYLFLRLHMPVPNTYLKIALEFLINVAINVVTIKIFWEKTFMWETSVDTQRFMW